MQYKDGTVTVYQGSPIVTGNGTRFLANVTIGATPPMFMLPGSGVHYVIASVVSDTELRLSADFAQSDAVNTSYSITKDFTPLLGLPEVAAGDANVLAIITQALRKLDSYMGLSPFNASPNGVIPLCGLDNGANQPGAVLQAEIDRLLESGVAPEKIIWFSTGTETSSTGTGSGTLTGASVATSVGTITGAGVTSTGTGALTGVSVATSTGTIGGVGMSSGTGLGTLIAVSVTTSTGQIDGTGMALGLADVTGVSATTSTGTITGTGAAASGTDGTGSLIGVSVATSVGTIDSNAAPYSTVNFSGFYDPVLGSADVTGVSAATSTGIITGIGISPNGTGSLTGVSAATSVGTISSNAAPYSTVSFSNFS